MKELIINTNNFIAKCEDIEKWSDKFSEIYTT